MNTDINQLFKKISYVYDLPRDLIAQYPLENRSKSRLMVLNKQTGELQHKTFCDVIDYLEQGDVLVLNTTKVIPARLFGVNIKRKKVEILLLQKNTPDNESVWLCLIKTNIKLKLNEEIFINNDFTAKLIEYNEDGIRLVQFFSSGEECNPIQIADKCGFTPLPIYISREAKDVDKEAYQTIYAKEIGSVAAPTAGLHFTDDLLERIYKKGVIITEVVLHVGLGTFRPVHSEDIRSHKMHSEYCTISKEAAETIVTAKSKGKKIIAVGTTTTRTLESFAIKEFGKLSLEHGSKWTNLFIYPGKEFKVIDALITNFHTPASSLLMLVSAFAGYEFTMEAYREAIKEKYRFFSYGDSMLII